MPRFNDSRQEEDPYSAMRPSLNKEREELRARIAADVERFLAMGKEIYKASNAETAWPEFKSARSAVRMSVAQRKEHGREILKLQIPNLFSVEERKARNEKRKRRKEE